MGLAPILRACALLDIGLVSGSERVRRSNSDVTSISGQYVYVGQTVCTILEKLGRIFYISRSVKLKRCRDSNPKSAVSVTKDSTLARKRAPGPPARKVRRGALPKRSQRGGNEPKKGSQKDTSGYGRDTSESSNVIFRVNPNTE